MINQPHLTNKKKTPPNIKKNDVIIPILNYQQPEIYSTTNHKIFNALITVIGFTLLCTIGSIIYFTSTSTNLEIDDISTNSRKQLSHYQNSTLQQPRPKEQIDAVIDLLNVLHVYNQMNTAIEMKKFHTFWALLHDSNKWFTNADKFLPYYRDGRNMDWQSWKDHVRFPSNYVYGYLETRKQIAINTWEKPMQLIRDDFDSKVSAVMKSGIQMSGYLPKVHSSEGKSLTQTAVENLHETCSDIPIVEVFNAMIHDGSYWDKLFKELMELQLEFISELIKIRDEANPDKDYEDVEYQHKPINGTDNSDKTYTWKRKEFNKNYAKAFDAELLSNRAYQKLHDKAKKIANNFHLWHSFSNNLERHFDPMVLFNEYGLPWFGNVFKFVNNEQEILIVEWDITDYWFSKEFEYHANGSRWNYPAAFYKTYDPFGAAFFGDSSKGKVYGLRYIPYNHESVLLYQMLPGNRKSQTTFLLYDDAKLYRPFAEEYSRCVDFLNQDLSTDYIELIKSIKTLVHLAKLNNIGDYLDSVKPLDINQDLGYNQQEKDESSYNAAEQKHLQNERWFTPGNAWEKTTEMWRSAWYFAASPAYVPSAWFFNEVIFQCKAIATGIFHSMGHTAAASFGLAQICYVYDLGGPLLVHFIAQTWKHGSIFIAFKETAVTAGKMTDPMFYYFMDQSNALLLPNVFKDLNKMDTNQLYAGMQLNKKEYYKKHYRFHDAAITRWTNICPSIKVTDKIHDVAHDLNHFKFWIFCNRKGEKVEINGELDKFTITKPLGILMLNDMATITTEDQNREQVLIQKRYYNIL